MINLFFTFIDVNHDLIQREHHANELDIASAIDGDPQGQCERYVRSHITSSRIGADQTCPLAGNRSAVSRGICRCGARLDTANILIVLTNDASSPGS
jgi:hypothetical protein